MTNPSDSSVSPESMCSFCSQAITAATPQAVDGTCQDCDLVLGWIRDHLSETDAIDPQQIQLDTSFVDDLGADSLEIVELMMAVEDAFEISIPDDDHDKIKTVGDAIQYIREAQMAAQK